MRSADFFVKLGLFAQPGFLDPALCARIHQEVSIASGSPGRVYQEGTEGVLDDTKRRTLLVDLSDQTLASIDARLHALRPQLEDHFGVSLTSHESPKACVYKKGDFFVHHQDAVRTDDAPVHLSRRQVSTVLFISDPREYAGGALVLYGLVDHGPWRTRGFRLESSPGLLLAFPPTLLHEVEPVLEGERVTVATFFF